MPVEVLELVDPRLLEALPALPPEFVAFSLAYFRVESPFYLNAGQAAHWAGCRPEQAMRSKRLARWVSAFLDGTPDSISVPEAKAFLSRVTLGEETTEVLDRAGEPIAVQFPAAARLKALELLGKIDGFLVDRTKVELEAPAAPAWDLSKLSGDQLEYLEYLQAVATGQEVPAPSLELVRVEVRAELTD